MLNMALVARGVHAETMLHAKMQENMKGVAECRSFADGVSYTSVCLIMWHEICEGANRSKRRKNQKKIL